MQNSLNTHIFQLLMLIVVLPCVRQKGGGEEERGEGIDRVS